MSARKLGDGEKAVGHHRNLFIGARAGALPSPIKYSAVIHDKNEIETAAALHFGGNMTILLIGPDHLEPWDSAYLWIAVDWFSNEYCWCSVDMRRY